jgi:ribonuclease P protein subunit POP4
MITSNNLVHHEFIGLNVDVRSENNKSLNLYGTVIDETKNTLKIESEGKEKIIPKNGSIFTFEIPSGEKVEVYGDILSIRPEDRIKKRFKKI